MTRRLKFIAAICICICVNALANEGADSERLRAVKQMLTTLHFGDAYIEFQINRYIESRMTSPELSKDLEWFGKHLSPAEALERTAPVYAEYLTAAQADELRIFFATPSGNKIWTALLEQTFTGKSSFIPPLNGEEKRRADIYLAKSRAWRTLNDSKKDIASKLAAVVALWGKQLQQRRQNEISTEQKLLPEISSLIQQIEERNSVILNAFLSKTKEIDLGSVISPSTLTSREGIENGRRKLALYEAEFSKSQREINQLNEELYLSLHKLGGAETIQPSLIKAAETGVANRYGYLMRTEENQRRLLGILKKLLNFADERFGLIRFQDQRLVFTETSDLRLYESLRQQLQIEAKIEAEITQEQKALRENSVKKLREIEVIPDTSKPRLPDA